MAINCQIALKLPSPHLQTISQVEFSKFRPLFSNWSGNSVLGFFRFSNSFTANFQLVVKPFPFVAEPWWQPQSHHHHHCCSPKQLSINNYYGHLHVENHQSSSKKVHHDHTMLIKPLMSCVINIANPKNACTQCRNWRNYLSSLYY